MSKTSPRSRFKAALLLPASPEKGESWAFVVLPRSASEKLPRRGRTSVEGTLDGHPFQAHLEPDGNLSHWLKVSKELRDAANVKTGSTVTLEIAPCAKELEPELPPDFRKVLATSPKARTVWDATTTVARIDWIHWIESAKQANTRKSRLDGALDMLASGKKRVCCFDPSGYYSKSLSAPQAAEQGRPTTVGEARSGAGTSHHRRGKP